MKKNYENPKILFDHVNIADVLTTSGGISFNNDQNSDINSKDVRSFSSFFGR